eukprot:1422853-Amphidinium_carterae.1
MLLQRETVLHETLSTLNHLQHNQHTSWSDSRHRLEGQRYWTGEEDPSDHPHGADETTWWEWPADGTYYDETDAYEEDGEDCDSEATDEDQWAEENAMDPYTPERLRQEQLRGQDPAYLAECYWAARRSVRRFRAATGKFQRRGFRKPFRKGKGKGKGKQTGKKGKPLPFMTGTFYEDSAHGGEQHHEHPYDVDSAYYKGKSKGKGKDKKGAQTPQASTSCPATHNQYPADKKRGNCHICGQPGHWKAECPHKKSFYVGPKEHTEAETSQGATWAGHAGHFHAVSAELPGQTGHFLTNMEPESVDDDTDIIHFGTCPAGEPCAPPDYVYMVSQQAMAGSSEANADARNRGGRSVPVHGTLNVQGHLWIREEDLQATTALTSSSSLGPLAQSPITIASMSQLRLHQSEQSPVDQQPTSREQLQYGQPRSSYSQIAQVQPSSDEFGNRLYDLQGLLGTKVTIRMKTTTNEEKGSAETKASRSRNSEQTETTLFFPGFRESMEAQDRALSQPLQFTMSDSPQAPPDESEVLYVYETDPNTAIDPVIREWFTADGRDAEPTNSRSKTQPRHTSATVVARLRRIDRGDEEHESQGHYPIFIDDVLPDTAYASNPIKPSHDRAMSQQHPATLLPDSGAVENLIGAKRASAFHKEATKQGMRASWTKLKVPKLVSGVGGAAQLIQHQFTVEGHIAPRMSIRYSAPVIEGDSAGVPALLGLREQAKASCVLLPNLKVMKILPSPEAETQIVWPAGTRTITMDQAASGHLLMPFLTKHDGTRRDSNHSCHNRHSNQPVMHVTEDQQQERIVRPSPTDIDIEVTMQYPLTMAQSRAKKRKEVWQACEAMLLDTHIKKATTRTNIHGDNVSGRQFQPRSALYGLHLTRGRDITRSCYDNPEVLQALHQIAMTRPQSRVDHPYAAIQITMSEPHQGLPAHRDAGNVGKSDIIGLGNYINGELWVASANGQHKLPSSLFPMHQTLPADSRRGSWHSINHRWYTFNGHNFHASKPYEGERISVIYFVPSGVEQADRTLHEELRRLGFPIPTHPDRASSWHTPIDHTADENSFAVDVTAALDHKADIKCPSRTVYVIAEQYRVLAAALERHHCKVLTTTHAHVRARHVVPEDLRILAADILAVPADILWIQYQGSAHPGRRAQTRLLKAYFLSVIRQHLPRSVVLECRASDIPIREEIIQAEEWKALLPHQAHVRACSISAPATVPRCSGYMVLSSFPIASTRCLSTCRVPSVITTHTQLDNSQVYACFVQHIIAALAESESSHADPSTASTATCPT